MIERATLVAAAPGLALVAVLAAIAYASTLVLPDIFGAVTVGLFLGIIVANVRPLPVTEPGARSAKAWFLPLGILLLGARLSLADILSTGLGAIVVLVLDIVLVLVVTLAVGRAFGLSEKLSGLIGVGTSICGNTAIAATAPVIKAPERDVSFAVATITLFGTAAVIVYPLIGHAVGMSDALFGHWVGAAVNDTSQVTATAFSYSIEAGETATIVKLTRNTLMVPVIFGVGLWFASRESRTAGTAERRSWLASARKAVPTFLIGFLALALVNSAGLIPDDLATLLTSASQVLIVMALVGVGLTTKISALRQTGPAPLLMGLAVAVMLAVVSLALFVAIGVE
ncbi:MAG: putative sulfate exporter family transporter [Candidatus Limnocylindrales bacterium]